MGISRFEELIAWQKARLLAAAIYRLTAQGAFSRDFGLRDQIQRAAVSVMSNIAENQVLSRECRVLSKGSSGRRVLHAQHSLLRTQHWVLYSAPTTQY
jgi:four helix bundle protein